MLAILSMTLLFIKLTHAYPVRISSYHQTTREQMAISTSQSFCKFPPNDQTLASVDSDHYQGWIVTDQYPCKPDSYCSFFCGSGYIVNPSYAVTTDYNSWKHKYGKVLCDSDGQLINRLTPLCVAKEANVYLVNLFDADMSFCQKVTPNEPSLLASNVIAANSYSPISIEQQFYGTVSDVLYLNPPGTGLHSACLSKSPISNKGLWSPYILDLSMDHNGVITVKLGWNPHYINDDYWGRVPPNWGVIVDCYGKDCGHTSCSIDPLKHGINECENGIEGHDGSFFCVVNVPKTSGATITLFSGDNLSKKYQSVSKVPFIKAILSSDPISSEMGESESQDQNRKPLDDDKEPGLEEPKEHDQEDPKEHDQEGPKDIEKITEPLEQQGDLEVGAPESKVDEHKYLDIPHGSSSSQKPGHATVLYVEFSGGDSSKKGEFGSKVSYAKFPDSEKGSNTKVFAQTFDGMSFDDSEAQSKEKKESDGSTINDMCRYLITQLKECSSKIYSFFDQNGSTEMVLSSSGEVVSQEGSALSTLRSSTHWLLIMMIGVVTLFRYSL